MHKRRVFSQLAVLVHVVGAVGWTAEARMQADLQMEPPVIATVYDAQAGILRTIEGAAGSPVLGSSLFALGSRPLRAHLPPAAQWALSEEGDGRLRVVGYGETFLGGDGLQRDSGAPGSVLFNPTARAVALWFPDRHALEVWTGLPSSPQLSWKAALPDSCRPLALSDGQELLAASCEDGVYTLGAGGEQERVAPWSAPAAAFRPGTYDLALAGGDRIRLYGHSAGGAFESVVASLDPEAAEVTRLAFTATGDWLVFTSRGEAAVYAARIGGGQLLRLETPWPPSSLRPAKGDIVLLDDTAKGPVLVLDFEQDAPRLSVAAGIERGETQ